MINIEYTNDEIFMREALRLAQTAGAIDEVPIGCVIVKDGIVVGQGFNERETKQNALRHAEITAIESACSALESWRLLDCDIYVTLEPCPMCAGAIINARLRRVVFGAYDPKAGAFGTVCDLRSYSFNHKPQILGGVLEEECAQLLREFFRKLR